MISQICSRKNNQTYLTIGQIQADGIEYGVLLQD